MIGYTLLAKEMPSPRSSNEFQRRGTATERARQPLVLVRNPQVQEFMEGALADRADDSIENLRDQLSEFLVHVIQEMSPFFVRLTLKYDDIEDMIFEKICDWKRKRGYNTDYTHSELVLHKKNWNVLKCDKDGAPREHEFVEWCRKIAACRDESIVAKHAATEHDIVDIDATEHNNAYRIMVEYIWHHELTPSQKKKEKYTIPESATIPNPLRSLVGAILRKHLGDARIATYILNYGVPVLLDVVLLRDREYRKSDVDKLLEELMMWYKSLLQWLDGRQNDPHTVVARKLSDPKQRQWQDERRRKKAEVERQMRQGAFLANLRDYGTKRYYDMSATERHILEAYDTGKLRKCHDELRIQKPK